MAQIDFRFCDPGALRVLRTLQHAGHEAYFVGGCVRDVLLGRVPKDWDIATSAVPDQVEKLFRRTIPVGKAFGVIMVVTADGQYEVATFRGDGNYVDGRRPENVAFTSAAEDAKRRDFTINALFLDPVEGRVLDYVSGCDDLRDGVLRTVGLPSERFQEDHLRVLRAVRFSACTGFKMHPETYRAVSQGAPLVRKVSAERVGAELARMLSAGHSAPSFELLMATGLAAVVLPEVSALEGCRQPPQFHPEGDVWEHTRLMLGLWDELLLANEGMFRGLLPVGICSGIRSEEPQIVEAMGWALLLHDVGKPLTFEEADRIRFHGHDKMGVDIAERILRRLRRPKKTTDLVCELIGEHMHFMHVGRMRTAKRRRFVRREYFSLHLILHLLDCLASHGLMDSFQLALNEWQTEQDREEPPEPLLKGGDLIDMGYTPGPEMGTMLRQLEDERLEGNVTDRDAAVQWILKTFPQPN